MSRIRIIKTSILVFLIISLAFAIKDPLFPHLTFLMHFVTVIGFLLMVADIWKNYVSLVAYTAFSLFLLLHIIGACWVYSFVPYNDWLVNTIGFDLDGYFGFQRNQFDRLVHFSFGLLYFPVFYELCERKLQRKIFSLLFAFLLVQFFSVLYELFEWYLTLVLGEKDVEGYNGQQGDMWDAQKDMGLAMLGAAVTWIIYVIASQLKPKPR
ncbi:MAG: DUF2238 domain-containing protein [Bacteroidota bacterium]